MELGSPPLYYEINRVCRSKDMSHLQNLGPYIKALGYVTALSERYRDQDDQIKTGQMVSLNIYNMSGVFILYRGLSLHEEYIDQYTHHHNREDYQQNKIRFRGYQSCTQNLNIALNFAFKSIESFE